MDRASAPTPSTADISPVPPGAQAEPDALADRAAKDLFGGEENARAAARLIADFVGSWERRERDTPPAVWLEKELRRFPDLWTGESEIAATAREIVASVERANADKASLRDHVKAGKSKASWLARRIERGAAAAGVANVGAWAENIENTLNAANAGMRDAILNRDGSINRNPNLDGFIAEHHHANSFNLDATAKGSPLRAEVLESRSRNAVDIVVRDGGGKIIRRYQSKSGADGKATTGLFGKGDYRGQRKLVPSGQADEVPGSVEFIEAGGARSRPLSKSDAKRLQEQARSGERVPESDWNDISRIDAAKRIGGQALEGAALASCFQGARVLGRRLWNSLRDEKNPPASEDLRDFFESSLDSAGHVGAQAAVSGAVTVAAKSGLVRGLQNTPAGRIAGIVHVGMENAKALFKFARGELSGEEALDMMGDRTCSAVGSIAGAVKGAAWGAAFGPIGSVIAGVVGGMAGGEIGKKVWKGGKNIAKKAAKVVEAGWRGVKRVARALNPLNWF